MEKQKLKVIVLRVTEQEAMDYADAAAKDSRSVNQWAKVQLNKAVQNG